MAESDGEHHFDSKFEPIVHTAEWSDEPSQLEDGAVKIEDEEPSYSFNNEIRFFFGRGIPLGLAELMEWGAPPMFAMVMAGRRRDESAHLQSALGYARVFWNCTWLMVMLALTNYMNTVIPGCIGANRRSINKP